MIKAYLVNSITLKKYMGEDTWGEPTARVNETVACYIDYKNRNVAGIDGTTVVSAAKIMIEPRTVIRSGFASRAAGTIAYEDLINFDDSDHAIIKIGRPGDFSTRFTEVYVQ